MLSGSPRGAVTLTELSDDGTALAVSALSHEELPAEIARRERESPRWVWSDTASWYPVILRAGIPLERSHDLRLCHRILRLSQATRGSELAAAPENAWDDAALPTGDSANTLFDDEAPGTAEADPVAEFLLQRRVLENLAARHPDSAARLRLLPSRTAWSTCRTSVPCSRPSPRKRGCSGWRPRRTR